MSRDYDLVVTSGGIGPTHDDITYQSIARAFELPLVLHQAALDRMKRLSKPHKQQPAFSWDVDSPARKARMRMVELPYDTSLPDKDQVLFVAEDLWVPISVVNGNIHILPGIPRLFEQLLAGLEPILLPRLSNPEGGGVHRIIFSTPLPESEVAAYLRELAGRVNDKGIKVGSYPRFGKSKNTVTLVGRDQNFMEALVTEVERGIRGNRVQVSWTRQAMQPNPWTII